MIGNRCYNLGDNAFASISTGKVHMVMSFQKAERFIRVAIIHPSFGENAKWIDEFVPNSSNCLFEKIVPPSRKKVSWHDRGPVTPLREWLDHFKYALKAIRSGHDVLVTNFPQLALTACFWKVLLRSDIQIVSWSFNIGSISNKLKGRLAGLFLRNAKIIVVHSSYEVEQYSTWMGLPEARFIFIPFQCGKIDKECGDPNEGPFVISLGSAGRDYRTLFSAVSGTSIDVVVVAKPDAVEGLAIPSNVKILNGISLIDSQRLASKAVLGVVPIANLETASGQVSFLQLMALGIPVIATACPGTCDYLSHEHDALVVPPYDVEALRFAIIRAWLDADLRGRLAANGLKAWRERFSDEAAGLNLMSVISQIAS